MKNLNSIIFEGVVLEEEQDGIIKIKNNYSIGKESYQTEVLIKLHPLLSSSVRANLKKDTKVRAVGALVNYKGKLLIFAEHIEYNPIKNELK